MQAQLKTARPVPPLREADTRPIPIAIGINRACKADPKEKLFLIPIAIGTNASKKIKNATHSRYTMTHNHNTDNGLQGRWTRTTGYNSTLAIGGVTSPLDSFVVAESSVLRTNFCAENPAHRQSAKR